MIEPMRSAAVLLASVSLVMALPAAASHAAAAKSVTIRVLVTPVTRSIKDVPPKTIGLGLYTRGDTIRGTSILRNAVRQFGRPKGARVGISRFVLTAVASQTVRNDSVARFSGGTVHARGVGKVVPNPKVPIVGGTGLYAGATGVVEGRHIAGGATLNILRFQVP